jgi:hypothetical protein
MAPTLPIKTGMGPSVIVIARAEHEVALRKRLGSEQSVALFADSEALKAFDAVAAHPPKILLLDRTFAFTARGASLVSRLKGDQRMGAIDLRVLTEDETSSPLILETKSLGLEGAVLKTSHPLDYCGTRRAPRFPITDSAGVVVNGENGTLVNLSATGAQLVVRTRLRPSEPLRLALIDSDAEVKVQGVVAWSSVESDHGALAYRAGVEFISPDAVSLDAFCLRRITTSASSSELASSKSA